MGVPLLCLLLYSAVVLDGCENAGLLGLTRVGSQRVVQISAGFMLFFSVLRRFRTVLASHTIANCGSSLLCHLCLCGNSGNFSCLFLGLHSQFVAHHNPLRQWQVLVGEVQIF
ncbi:putative nucleobase-ascorbate transporter 9 isoform X3 [Populus alba]|uniref:putative nucleobase-ascorbate transporter 9 isoform X3 n=1 Tax=Populus alba TaxID=43335 RepID=UPI003CC75BE5